MPRLGVRPENHGEENQRWGQPQENQKPHSSKEKQPRRREHSLTAQISVSNSAWQMLSLLPPFPREGQGRNCSCRTRLSLLPPPKGRSGAQSLLLLVVVAPPPKGRSGALGSKFPWAEHLAPELVLYCVGTSQLCDILNTDLAEPVAEVLGRASPCLGAGPKEQGQPSCVDSRGGNILASTEYVSLLGSAPDTNGRESLSGC